MLDSVTAYSYVAWVFDFLSKKKPKKKIKKKKEKQDIYITVLLAHTTARSSE